MDLYTKNPKAVTICDKNGLKLKAKVQKKFGKQASSNPSENEFWIGTTVNHKYWLSAKELEVEKGVKHVQGILGRYLDMGHNLFGDYR